MKTALLLAGLASLSLATSASSAVLFFDGFEGDTPGAPAGALVNFETVGTIDVVGAVNPYGIVATSNVVDLDGSPGPGEITSRDTFSFGANQFVDLSFILGGAQRGSVSDSFFARLIFDAPTTVAGFGGTGVFAGEGCVGCTLATISTFDATVAGNAAFSPSSLFFTSTSAGTLRFAFGTTSADNIGPLIDSVTLTGVVPEPATWAMMIGGFGMAGAVLRRRRALAHAA